MLVKWKIIRTIGSKVNELVVGSFTSGIPDTVLIPNFVTFMDSSDVSQRYYHAKGIYISLIWQITPLICFSTTVFLFFSRACSNWLILPETLSPYWGNFVAFDLFCQTDCLFIRASALTSFILFDKNYYKRVSLGIDKEWL